MLSGSLLIATTAHAMTAEEQLNAMKEMFVNEFQSMDDNKDGMLSKDEFLTHQFENFRAHVIESNGFGTTSSEVKIEPEVKETTAETELGGVPAALQAMAEFDIDEESDAVENPTKEADNLKLTKEDVLPDTETVEEQKSAITEEENLDNLLKDMESQENPAAIANTAPKENEMNMMMETIKKTLPKKIDEITSWVDIQYANNTISYIYQADIDTTTFSAEEKAALSESIKKEACTKAYQDMCPKVKPMFIDNGIFMQIRYFDKNNEELNSCEFNTETCQ